MLVTLRSANTLPSFAAIASDGRARERHRRAAYSAAASTLARVVGLATSLIVIRLTLSYLGAERFGLWMTIWSLQTFIVFGDLGIGNGVLNAVADASGRGETAEIQRYINSALLLLTSISIVSLLALVSTYRLFHFGNFFNLHSALAMEEVTPALVIFGACAALDITSGLVQRVQLGLQLGFLANCWQIVGSLLALAGVLSVIRFRGSLPVLVLAFCGAPVISKIVNGCIFFSRQHPELRPTFTLPSSASMRKVSRLAFLFFVLNVAVALAFQSDNLIISHVLGPIAVTQYAVPQKLFSLIALGLATLIEPLWPAYAEAISRGDGHWVRRTLTWSLIASVSLAALLSASFVLLGPKIIHLWVGDRLHVSLILLAGFGVWTVIQAGGNAVAMFLNGAAIIKAQVIIASIFAVCAVVVKVAFVRRWGIDAMPWATMGAYLLVTVLPYAFVVPRIAYRTCRPAPTSSKSIAVQDALCG